MENKELETWLKETKAKNLSRWELQQEIDLIIDRGFLVKIQGLNSYDKANYLFNQWQKEKEFSPKRGDRVLVWDNNDDPVERIFLAEIKGTSYPIVVVRLGYENEFINNGYFHTNCFMNMKPLPTEHPTETDFKSQVIELIEENIEECKILTKAALKNQCYDTASKYNNKHEMCEELLIKIKQLY